MKNYGTGIVNINGEKIRIDLITQDDATKIKTGNDKVLLNKPTYIKLHNNNDLNILTSVEKFNIKLDNGETIFDCIIPPSYVKSRAQHNEYIIEYSEIV